MGPDALVVTQKSDGLEGLLGSTRQPIKVALMNQRFMAGVGNIYASEALFEAGISPFLKGQALTSRQFQRLSKALRMVMLESLARESGAEIDYMTQGGENLFSVYGKSGRECTRCGGEIRKVSQAARTTFWCPTCQPDTAHKIGKV